MNIQSDHLHQSKRGAAILVACIAQTLNESDPSFEARFVDRLERAYREIRDDADALDALELLSWVRTLLTGFDHTSGQGKPFLG